ncbi:hypothetical protein CUU66_15515 [Peribacillus deserti]|uniref:Uncharacterized protein n=1 Tax=Peribacillus deserti TaxID=673318 RepID=A0A2N5M3Z4_9BACI|nr:hypothetical protein CUU66_15515 [Peribacillus deserti]
MLKGNSYILVFSVLIFLLILLASNTLLIIRTLLIVMTIGFLFPIIRKTLFKDKFRKFKVAFYSSLTFTSGIILISFLTSMNKRQLYNSDGEVFLFMIVVLFYSLIGNFVYGLPVSLMAEFISMKFFNVRFWLSGFIHIGFGLLTYFIYPGFFIPAIISSIIFFAIDEITKKSSTAH